MQFSFGEHDNLNDIRYLLFTLNLENCILFIEDILSIDYLCNIPSLVVFLVTFTLIFEKS